MPEIEAGRAVTGVPGAGFQGRRGLRTRQRDRPSDGRFAAIAGGGDRGYLALSTSLRAQRSNPFFLFAARWIASRSLSSGAHSRDPLARNDGWIQFRALATLIARGLPVTLPSTNRGRREDRVLAAPAVSRAICANKNAHEHTGSAEAFRPSLRSGFTAYAVLSPETNSSCLRRCRLDG